MRLRGILLIATGEPYYGRMAYNLAMSIKATDADSLIAVAHSGPALNHLSGRQRQIFDYIIDMPADALNSFGSKLYLDLITPFDETLFCDADTAWLPRRSPNELFNEVQECDFTAITEGFIDLEKMDRATVHPKYYFWADVENIKERFDLNKGNLYQWRSEVMYFKKTDRVLSFFDKAREIYANPGLSTIHLFADRVPDELAINISATIHGIEPHKYQWMPAYWPRMNNEFIPPIDELYSTYYLLSCGSNVSSGNTKLAYNRIIKAAAYKIGHQHVFPLISKKEFMTSRARM